MQKGKIKKFQHNNGQGYTKGQISNWQNMTKSGGYSKVKRDKTKKPKNSKNINSQNIFSQTFGNQNQSENKAEEILGPNHQVPFVDVQGPPKTAKFDKFNKNIPKSKKSADNFSQLNLTTFTGQSFSGTYNMDGPLKSSRVHKKDPILDSKKCKLKKAKSSNEDELMQDQSSINVPISK